MMGNIWMDQQQCLNFLAFLSGSLPAGDARDPQTASARTGTFTFVALAFTGIELDLEVRQEMLRPAHRGF
jgi:hypothetical protein